MNHKREADKRSFHCHFQLLTVIRSHAVSQDALYTLLYTGEDKVSSPKCGEKQSLNGETGTIVTKNKSYSKSLTRFKYT